MISLLLEFFTKRTKDIHMIWKYLFWGSFFSCFSFRIKVIVNLVICIYIYVIDIMLHSIYILSSHH